MSCSLMHLIGWGGRWVVLMCGFVGHSALQWVGSNDQGAILLRNKFLIHYNFLHKPILHLFWIILATFTSTI